MSATPAPAPVSPPHPHGPPPHHSPRPGAQPVGCLPFMVFILSVACGAGFLSLRCGCLPKEDAWQTVIEILDSPTPAEMKAHVRRITSGEVINRAARNAGDDLPDKRKRGEMHDQVRRHVEVSADGPFITITAYDNRQSPLEMAHLLAENYQEDLVDETVEPRRRLGQNSAAQINVIEASTEKARLEWMEIARRHGVTPDGASPVDTAAVKEITTRLAKAKLERALGEKRATMPESDAAAAQSEARKQAVEISTLEAAFKEHQQNLRNHQQLRSEMDTAKANYERQIKLLNSLKETSMEQRVKDGVVIRPVRVVDEARPVKVTDRHIRKYVQFGAYASAVLVASLLLCALAGRLCRRGP